MTSGASQMYCRKCQIEAPHDAKICRACGSILDDEPEEYAQLDETPDAPYPMSWLDPPPEPIDAVATAPAEFVESPRPLDALEGIDWRCERCGSRVPWNYDTCWKCVSVQEELVDQPDLKDFLDQAEASDAASDVPADLPTEAAEIVSAESEPLRIQCPACGSARIMTNLAIQDPESMNLGTLKVVFLTDPDLAIVHGVVRSELKADICGDCGHVELRVRNPRQLYRYWQKTKP